VYVVVQFVHGGAHIYKPAQKILPADRTLHEKRPFQLEIATAI